MKKYILTLISILVIILIPGKVLAVELTDENLESALEGLVNYKIEDNGELVDANFIDSYSLDKDNKKMTIVVKGDTYVMDYTLGENPSNINYITTSTTYDDYSAKSDSSMWMLPYMLVAKNQGIKYEDSFVYAILAVFKLYNDSNFNITDSSAIIVDDDANIEGFTETVVRKSEYGQYMVDYIKSTYGSTETIFHDNGTELFNTFKVDVYATNQTATSVTINYKLYIDTTKDFSQMNGQYEKLDTSLSQLEETFQSETKPTVLTQNGGQEIKVPDTANNIPKIIIITGLFITTIGAILLLKYLNTKTIKVEE